MKLTKSEIQAIKAAPRDSYQSKFHKHLQTKGKNQKEIIDLLDCHRTTIWQTLKKYEEE